MNPAPIGFWFALTSPYAYFAGFEVDALATRHAAPSIGNLSCWA